MKKLTCDKFLFSINKCYNNVMNYCKKLDIFSLPNININSMTFSNNLPEITYKLCCIYFFAYKKSILYVGKSTNLKRRYDLDWRCPISYETYEKIFIKSQSMFNPWICLNYHMNGFIFEGYIINSQDVFRDHNSAKRLYEFVKMKNVKLYWLKVPKKLKEVLEDNFIKLYNPQYNIVGRLQNANIQTIQ